jgi:hypothetical protein
MGSGKNVDWNDNWNDKQHVIDDCVALFIVYIRLLLVYHALQRGSCKISLRKLWTVDWKDKQHVSVKYVPRDYMSCTFACSSSTMRSKEGQENQLRDS